MRASACGRHCWCWLDACCRAFPPGRSLAACRSTAEIATPGRKGFFTSWQSGSQQVAIMVAAAMGFALSAMLEESAIREWGWRIPFLFGCLIVPFIFFLRRKLEETEEFRTRRHTLAMRQVFTTLLANWPVVVAGMLMVAMTTTAFYLITVYAPTFGKSVNAQRLRQPAGDAAGGHLQLYLAAGGRSPVGPLRP